LVKSGSRKGNYQYFQTFIQSYNGLKALWEK
jgi:hypothetical protein